MTIKPATVLAKITRAEDAAKSTHADVGSREATHNAVQTEAQEAIINEREILANLPDDLPAPKQQAAAKAAVKKTVSQLGKIYKAQAAIEKAAKAAQTKIAARQAELNALINPPADK